MLERLAEDLWVAFHPLRIASVLPFGTRMTVIRLPSKRLFVCSPVPLDASLRREVDALGRVTVICAPNKMHHLFVKPWTSAYPDALAIAAPGLREKRADVPFRAVWDGTPRPELEGVIEHACLAGMPRLEEVVFLHRPSRTLVITDLALNFTRKPGDPWSARLYYALTGAGRGFGQNSIVRSTIRDTQALRRSLEPVLRWDFDRIVLPHGDLVLEGGKPLLEAATAWLR